VGTTSLAGPCRFQFHLCIRFRMWHDRIRTNREGQPISTSPAPVQSLTVPYLLVLALIILIADTGLFSLAVSTFRREEILTKWK